MKKCGSEDFFAYLPYHHTIPNITVWYHHHYSIACSMSPPSLDDDDPPLNEYEALRQAKIARNQARLRALGLLGPSRVATVRSAPPRKTPAAAAAATAATAIVTPRRRSPRISSTVEPRVTRSQKRRWEGDEKAASAVVAEQVAPPKRRAPTTVSAPPAPNSARALTLNVNSLLHDVGLGRRLEHTGKAAVMQRAAKHCHHDNNTMPRTTTNNNNISFNKYSGVQEWRNAVFLWINRGAPRADVVNTFYDTDHVTWFGGSRLHDAAPVVQRLTNNASSLSSSNNIVLWSRQYDGKTFTPYQCLGRLRYVSHEPGSQPLAFCFRLLDYERLPVEVQNELHTKM